MASYDSSFNANAPTVVAFECVTLGPRAFGAGVNGNQPPWCGVHGEGMQNPQGSRAVDVQRTGVHGRGDFHGVYGIDGSIAAAQAPNLGQDLPPSPPVTPAPIGVVGVTNHQSPAILGDNQLLQADISGMPVNPGGRTNMDDARALGVGVEGVSKAGHGIFGLAFTGDLRTSLEIPLFLNGTIPSEPGSVTTSGVAGLSVKGPGILGISHEDRGGLFISGTSSYSSPTQGPPPGAGPVAQIRLFPHDMNATQIATPSTARVQDVIPFIVQGAPAGLPKQGRMGDLLVTQNPDVTPPLQDIPSAPPCTLWLCVSSAPGSCAWAQVLVGPVVVTT